MDFWSHVRRICPDLNAVERIALAAHRDGLPWANLLRQIEPELFHLVGHSAQNPRLRSVGVYRIALEHLATVWAHGRPERKTQETCHAVA